MQTSRNDEVDADLPAPGQRWGTGAQSVLPYLTKSLQARPSLVAEPRELRPREGHPVFADRSRPAAG